MKIFTFLGVLCSTFLVLPAVHAQTGWPKTTTVANGTIIKMYEWQPESRSDDKLTARAAISVLESGNTEPVFGVAWFEATTAASGNEIQVQSIYITDIKLPGEQNDDKLEAMAVALEKQAPSWGLTFSQSELQASLELNQKETSLSQKISNTPPKVIYHSKPSILVLIDGTPRLEHNPDWGVDAVVNTPFAIVKYDGRYFLYGGKHWYAAASVTGSYSMTTDVPARLNKVAEAVNQANKNNEAQEKDANTIYEIIVSTEPAELIQTKGEANFAAVNGTGLLYVSNTENDIFMDIDTQQYYVLISGRWYRSKTLSGNWQYMAPDQLPAGFAKIPAGSPKDNVLASVAGTPQAADAVKEAQVPQTAKVDRKTAKAAISYDGEPEFEAIEGTDMYYAVNSPASVIRWRGRYYAVDNGIWFESYSALGPWSVSVVRPYAVSLIPPRYPVYYVKYVYVYDYTPDFVYVGYTPGYLNTYISGPVVVYGTGYYYRPWYRRYYYPRPCTWGYGVRYNPWYGWGLNIGFSTGWFHVNIGVGNYSSWNYWGYGGWWGPRVYRPPYCYTPVRYGGYYGGGWYGTYAANRGRNVNNVNVNITNITYNNNIYRARRDVVVTRDNQRYVRPTRTSNMRNSYTNNRFNNANRFNNNGNNINRIRTNQRNDLPPGTRGDRTRTFRQNSSAIANNTDAVNRANRGGREGANGRPVRAWRNNDNNGNTNRANSDNTFRRNGNAADSRPNREWRNNSNISSPGNAAGNRPNREWRNSNNNSNNTNPGNANRPVQRERTWQNTGNQPNRNESDRFRNRSFNNGNRNETIRREGNGAVRPENRQPVRREFNRPQVNNRPDPVRRAPERVVQQQRREPPPARRNIERPQTRTQNSGSYRTPQMQRRPEVNRPPARESIRRDNVRPRSGGAGQARPSRAGSNHSEQGRRPGRGN